MSEPQAHDDHGSFVGGLTVGLFAGAVGYFLFATDKGRETRQELEKEWAAAKEKLAKEGVIESKDVTLRELINQGIAKMVGSDWVDRSTELTPKKPRKRSSPKKSVKKFKKFKNT